MPNRRSSRTVRLLLSSMPSTSSSAVEHRADEDSLLVVGPIFGLLNDHDAQCEQTDKGSKSNSKNESIQQKLSSSSPHRIRKEKYGDRIKAIDPCLFEFFTETGCIECSPNLRPSDVASRSRKIRRGRRVAFLPASSSTSPPSSHKPCSSSAA